MTDVRVISEVAGVVNFGRSILLKTLTLLAIFVGDVELVVRGVDRDAGRLCFAEICSVPKVSVGSHPGSVRRTRRGAGLDDFAGAVEDVGVDPGAVG